MRKVRTTVTISEDTLRWVKVRAAREGKGDSEVIEEALRRDRGTDIFEKLWQKNLDVDEKEAIKIGLEAQAWARRRRATRRGK